MKLKIIILLLTVNISLFSTSDEILWNKSVDWENNRIELNVKSPLNIKHSTLSTARMKSETWIDDNLTNIFFKNILDIPVDSLNSVSMTINKNPDTYYLLDNLSESLEPDYSRLTTNLEYLETKYSFPIYPDFASVFYKSTTHREAVKNLDHIEYGKYTGLIIYVPKELPLYRKDKNGVLTKVLFPKIYDDEMNLILDFTMVEPQFIKKWGVALYGTSFDESLYQERVGISPLRVVAKGLFGKNNSDIIISKEEADKLTGSIQNIKILSQARILIIN